MSGGSYNYLCFVDIDDIFNREFDLSTMRDRLAGLGYAQDAAAETEDLILILRQVRVRLQARIDRLEGVWRAVEWWDSGDSGEEALMQELNRYRVESAQC